MARLSAEVRAILSFLAASGVPHRISSTYRLTNTRHGWPGTDGWGLAVDIAGPKAGRDTPELKAVFEVFRPVRNQLRELYYSGPDAGYNVRRGEVVPVATIPDSIRRGHHDHVHVSVVKGIFLTPQVKRSNPQLVVGQLLRGDMRPYQISVTLDSDGNGYYDIPSLYKSRVVNAGVTNSADPAPSGYKPNPIYGALQIGSATRIVIRGGLPDGRLDFTTWAIE